MNCSLKFILAESLTSTRTKAQLENRAEYYHLNCLILRLFFFLEEDRRVGDVRKKFNVCSICIFVVEIINLSYDIRIHLIQFS